MPPPAPHPPTPKVRLGGPYQSTLLLQTHSQPPPLDEFDQLLPVPHSATSSSSPTSIPALCATLAAVLLAAALAFALLYFCLRAILSLLVDLALAKIDSNSLTDVPRRPLDPHRASARPDTGKSMWRGGYGNPGEDTKGTSYLLEEDEDHEDEDHEDDDAFAVASNEVSGEPGRQPEKEGGHEKRNEKEALAGNDLD